MRQVPTYHYGIIGNGRAAKHICHYLQLLSIPFSPWSRATNKPNSLAKILTNCDRVLILINDDAIEEFIIANPGLQNKTLLHFSGKLSTPLAYSAHPLTTFSSNYYDLATYRKIPFFIENEGPEFNELLPGLDNIAYKIPHELKNLYHSLCVLSGNFTSLLWQKFFSELENTFKIPKAAAYPYMERIFYNLQNNAENALTGPLVRNDQITIAANVAALSGDPFQKIYQAFVTTYQEITANEHS